MLALIAKLRLQTLAKALVGNKSLYNDIGKAYQVLLQHKLLVFSFPVQQQAGAEVWEGGRQLVCCLQAGRAPIVFYKEEVLHWDPYIVLFHDVITDKEANVLKLAALSNVGNRGPHDEPLTLYPTQCKCHQWVIR